MWMRRKCWPLLLFQQCLLPSLNKVHQLHHIQCAVRKCFSLFPVRKVLDSSKLNEFAGDIFEVDENSRKVLSKGRKDCKKEKLLEQFIAPLAEGQRAIVMALCPASICPSVRPFVHL